MKDPNGKVFPEIINKIRCSDPKPKRLFENATDTEIKVADDFIEQFHNDIVQIIESKPNSISKSIDLYEELYNKYCTWHGFENSLIGKSLQLYIEFVSNDKPITPEANVSGLINDIRNILRKKLSKEV